MPVTIDFTMVDFSMILLIVVLPAWLFLRTSSSHGKVKYGFTQDSHAKSKVNPFADSKVNSDIGALHADKLHAVTYDKHFIQHFRGLPEDLLGGVVQFLTVADVAGASVAGRSLQETLWKDSKVWQVLGTRFDVKITNLCVSQCREAVRKGAWRHEFECIKDLAMEVKKNPPGDPSVLSRRLLTEGNRFIRRLRPEDGFIAAEFCELMRPSLRCHSTDATSAAEELLASSWQSSFPQEISESLCDSYKHGVLQQNLWALCIKEHDDMFQAQLSDLEASIEEESNMMQVLDFDLDSLLQAERTL